jgi:tripartite-type tricarboxylate transporter receptor subunit TctC
VPYAGYPQVYQGLQGGDLQLSMLPPALAMQQIQAGKLRGIGVTSAARSPLAPGLPSLKELGVQNFDLEIWNAVAAPKAMPRAHVDKLAAAVSAIVRTPDMRAKLAVQGWQVVGSSPEGLSNRIQQDVKALGTIIREQGIRGQ